MGWEYETDDCSGEATPMGNLTATGEILAFSCDEEECSWATGCSWIGCGVGANSTGDCSSCMNDEANYDLHCFPVVTNECFGDLEFGQLQFNECDEDGLLTENFYFGVTNCSGVPTFSEEIGGENATTNCIYSDNNGYNTYYASECMYPSTTLPPDTTIAAETTEDPDDSTDDANKIQLVGSIVMIGIMAIFAN